MKKINNNQAISPEETNIIKSTIDGYLRSYNVKATDFDKYSLHGLESSKNFKDFVS